MHGPDGNHVRKMTIDEYSKWQRWDEWPERSGNPPLTVETVFWYKENKYMVTSLRNEYVIVAQPDFTEVICNENFKDLLDMPFVDGKSFRALMPELLFEV